MLTSEPRKLRDVAYRLVSSRFALKLQTPAAQADQLGEKSKRERTGAIDAQLGGF